jgi:cytosine/adenosine deaminase-related metal-dependent hydrolase
LVVPEDYFDAATLGGADALLRADLGRIEAGACADLVVSDLGLPHQYQAIDPIQTLLLTGRGRDARMVIVDGRFAMEDRVIPGVDETEFTTRA